MKKMKKKSFTFIYLTKSRIIELFSYSSIIIIHIFLFIIVILLECNAIEIIL